MADLYVLDDGTVIDVFSEDEIIIDVSAVDGEFSIVPFPGIQGARGETGPAGRSANSVCEVLSQQIQNGTNATFTLSNLLDTTQAVQVFRNGLLEVPGIGFTSSSTSIVFSTAPLATDVVAVIYQKVQ